MSDQDNNTSGQAPNNQPENNNPPAPPPSVPRSFGPQVRAGSFSGGVRGVHKATAISKNVKIAIFAGVSVAAVAVIWGIVSSGVHQSTSSANAPKDTGAMAARAPNVNKFVYHGAAATSPTSSNVSGATGATHSTYVPAISGADRAKELQKLQQIAIQGTEQRAQAIEQAKTTRLQSKITSTETAYTSPTLIPVKKKQTTTGGAADGVGTAANPETASMNVPMPTNQDYSALLKKLDGGNGGGGIGGGGGGGYSSTNMQGQKARFLKKAENQMDHDYLHQIVKAPISPYELQAGEVIPALLVTKIDSDLPGQITGQVSQNVYSDINGALLIPQGSRLVGLYNSSVSYGQTRVQVAWTRLIFPDGSSINLNGMVGSSRNGQAGLHDEVDNHFWTIFESALLYSVLGAGAQLAQPQQSATFGQAPSVGQTIGQAVGTEIASTGQEIVSRDLNIQPTLKIRAGDQFLVMVNKDMVFPGAYKGAR